MACSVPNDYYTKLITINVKAAPKGLVLDMLQLPFSPYTRGPGDFKLFSPGPPKEKKW